MIITNIRDDFLSKLVIRHDFICLNRAYTLDFRYYSRKMQRRFYFNSDESKIFLGLSGPEFTYIYEKYLKHHEWRFRTFDGKEVLACLMLLIRSGQSQNFVHSFIQKYTNQSVTIQALRKGLKYSCISYYIDILNHAK